MAETVFESGGTVHFKHIVALSIFTIYTMEQLLEKKKCSEENVQDIVTRIKDLNQLL